MNIEVIKINITDFDRKFEINLNYKCKVHSFVSPKIILNVQFQTFKFATKKIITNSDVCIIIDIILKHSRARQLTNNKTIKINMALLFP